MKKFLINLSLVASGIFGTLGFQMYFTCADEQATCTTDSTKVDSTIVPVVIQDTAKTDSVK